MTELHACTPDARGWREEFASEVLASLLAAIDGGGDASQVVARAMEFLDGTPRVVSRCSCGAALEYRRNACGHDPWDRRHGGSPECFE